MPKIITNETRLIKFQSDWDGVGKMFERMRRLVVGTFAGGGLPTSRGLAKVVYNLPVLLAFDLLKDVVEKVRDEGKIVWPTQKLWEGAQIALPSKDWDELMAGVKRRNKIAHDGELFECSICCKDIKNVQEQLVTWGIIDPTKRIEYLP